MSCRHFLAMSQAVRWPLQNSVLILRLRSGQAKQKPYREAYLLG
jgi:hypothetical protein